MIAEVARKIKSAKSRISKQVKIITGFRIKRALEIFAILILLLSFKNLNNINWDKIINVIESNLAHRIESEKTLQMVKSRK